MQGGGGHCWAIEGQTSKGSHSLVSSAAALLPGTYPATMIPNYLLLWEDSQTWHTDVPRPVEGIPLCTLFVTAAI